MKYIDTITPIKKQPALNARKTGSRQKFISSKGFYPYYFYKSLQIVLTFWVVTVLAIITQPWLDYWVKSTIKNNSPAQVLSESTSAPQNGSANVQQMPQFSLQNGKVGITAPIIEGIGDDSLKQGIGHHPDSVWPSEQGNVVLAGHNFDLDVENPFGKVFISLRLVDVGDEVTISYRGKKYIYQVFKKETVSAKDTTLFGKSDEWLLTFYTCDPPYTDWKRLVLQARLTKIE